MKKWLEEEWRFEITVIKGESQRCRLGLETGDIFTCGYECPGGFCPKTIPVLYTLCEIVRCGGNFRLRGSLSPREISFPCADGCLEFHLKAIRL